MNHFLLHTDDPGTRRIRFAAAAAAAAGVIHVAASVPHFSDDILLGAGFVTIGWLQIMLATLLFRGHDEAPVLWGGVALSLVALGGWAVSRTVGLPLGHPGAEPVGLPDLVTAVFEVLTLGVLGWRLARPRIRRMSSAAALVALLATWALVIVASTAAIADLGVGGHGDGGDHHAAAMDEHAEGVDEHTDADAGHHEDEAVAAAALHEHADRSLHLHVEGDAHQHDDGTVHVHRNDADDAPAGHDNSDGHHDEPDTHTHAPGEEH